MTHRAAIAILAFSLAICGTQVSAQTSDSQSGQSPTTPPHVMTPPLQILVSGCLKRSSDGGYYLTDSNGITWQLSSNSVNLGDQVMHVVSVAGKPGTMGQPEQSPNQAAGKPQPSDTSARSLRVITLKMLSNSCTR